MKCPYCGHSETSVVDSRETEDLNVIRRRRECESCKKRFTTYERIEMIELTVIKKDGKREPFDRNKILRGMMKAVEKRPVPVEKIESAVDEIERELRAKDSIEVQSKEIGELVMKKLKAIDKVAYVRFASVYKAFEDVQEFEKELGQLKK